MKTIQDLLQSRSDLVKEMENFLNTVEAEERDFTDEETEQYDKWEASLRGMDKEIEEIEKEIKKEERKQRLADAKKDMADFGKRAGTYIKKMDYDKEKEFKNLGEFLYTIAANDDDKRLQELRAQQVGQGALGGYMVPEQFSTDILSVAPDEAVVRPRATVIPPGNVPDAPFRIPALSQGAASNRWGNFTVYHQGELKTLTESNIQLRQITLTPHKMTGYMTTSNELLRNWAGSNEFLQRQMRLAMIAAEDTDFLSGNGVDKAKGVQSANAAKTINRGTANQISYTDIVNMISGAKLGSNLVWVASQTTIPQLANIRDTGNNNLWIQSAVSGVPNTLMGYPVLFSERLPALGTKADLMLCDFSYYLIKNGSGPLVSMSEHVNFTTDAMAFRIIWYVDGAAWLDEAIPLEGATSNTVSPFVILDTP